MQLTTFSERGLSKSASLARAGLIYLLVFEILHVDSGWFARPSLPLEAARQAVSPALPGQALRADRSPAPSLQQYLVPEPVGKGESREKTEKRNSRLRSKEWQRKLKIVPSAVIKEIRLTGGCFFCQEWFVMQQMIPAPAPLISVVSLTDKKELGLTSLEPQRVRAFVCFHACACFKRQPRD